MSDLAGFPPRAFTKADPTPDTLFYAQPRLVTHIDDGAIAAVTQIYRDTLPPGGTILDLSSSWVSHLPPEVTYAQITGHGMNDAELRANPRLDVRFVQDLNANQVLPLADRTFDGACQCVSVQYMQHPVAVFREVARVLKPGAPFVVTFSNRCFPTKAVTIWQALASTDQQQLVGLYLTRAGFASIEMGQSVPSRGDPLWAVIGRTPTE